MPVETVNLHVWAKCNLHCAYCYGRFPERPPFLRGADWSGILDDLANEGVRRVTFSGGEPTLHPDLEPMLAYARQVGLQTSIITNGARLTRAHVELLDVVAITADSANDETLILLGRGKDYLRTLRRVAALIRLPTLLKVNTVVTRLNMAEDLTPLIRSLRPFKWKPLQFVHVPGENDDSATALAVRDDEFDGFVSRHAAIGDELWFAPESARTIQTTYVMVDPLGRLFQHAEGGHVRSRPLLDIGLRTALREVGGYDRLAFEARGGHVDVRRLPMIRGGST